MTVASSIEDRTLPAQNVLEYQSPVASHSKDGLRTSSDQSSQTFLREFDTSQQSIRVHSSPIQSEHEYFRKERDRLPSSPVLKNFNKLAEKSQESYLSNRPSSFEPVSDCCSKTSQHHNQTGERLSSLDLQTSRKDSAQDSIWPKDQTRSQPATMYTISMTKDRELVLPLEKDNILAIYGRAEKRLLLLDYDGTLVKIEQEPDQAVLPTHLFEFLRVLVSQSKNEVWVISGRDLKFLQQQLGHIEAIGLVAEHGAFLRPPNNDYWLEMAPAADLSWIPIVRNAFNEFISQNPGSQLEEKKAAVALHYRNAERMTPDNGEIARQLSRLVGSLQVRTKYKVNFLRGKCVLEGRPHGINKGEIVKVIMEGFRRVQGRRPDFVLCVGDDTTDEGMLAAIPLIVL